MTGLSFDLTEEQVVQVVAAPDGHYGEAPRLSRPAAQAESA